MRPRFKRSFKADGVHLGDCIPQIPECRHPGISEPMSLDALEDVCFHGLKDAGDDAPSRKRNITCAGASVTTKKNCCPPLQRRATSYSGGHTSPEPCPGIATASHASRRKTSRSYRRPSTSSWALPKLGSVPPAAQGHAPEGFFFCRP